MKIAFLSKILTDGLGTQRRGSLLRYVGLYRPGKHPGGAISPPPDFILSGEYMAHDPHGSSSNFNTLEGEWYCRSKILATLSYFGGKKATRRRDRSVRRVITDWIGCHVTSSATPSPLHWPLPRQHLVPRTHVYVAAGGSTINWII